MLVFGKLYVLPFQTRSIVLPGRIWHVLLILKVRPTSVASDLLVCLASAGDTTGNRRPRPPVDIR